MPKASRNASSREVGRNSGRKERSRVPSIACDTSQRYFISTTSRMGAANHPKTCMICQGMGFTAIRRPWTRSTAWTNSTPVRLNPSYAKSEKSLSSPRFSAIQSDTVGLAVGSPGQVKAWSGLGRFATLAKRLFWGEFRALNFRPPVHCWQRVVILKKGHVCYAPPDMIVKARQLLYLAICAGLAGCAPIPSDVPSDASRSWSLKSEFTWSWSMNLEHGCVAWLAKEAWASVFVLVDSQCEVRGNSGFLDGKKGLSYISFEDSLVFRGWWPWTQEMWSDMLVFDDEGMLTGGNVHPCPHTLTENQIESMRLVAIEALNVAATDGERRMLDRTVERLAATNGQELSSSQAGCTDKPLDPTQRASAKEVDPWQSR